MSDLTTKDALLERAVAALEKLKTSIGEINPVGVVQAFAGTDTPDGWLLCDGSAVSRTDYADLYTAIGDTYGAGDGSATFNLPNLADKFIQGNATSGTTKAAGLPDITGEMRGIMRYSDTNTDVGAFTAANEGYFVRPASSSDAGSYATHKFKASDSNTIYGGSSTVQPPALTMRYIIKY